MKRQVTLSTCAALAAFLPGVAPGVQAQTESATMQERQIVAASIREKGFSCQDVSDMQRSTEGAAQGRTVWIAQCASGTYKVTFMGDTGFTVSRVE